MGLKKLLISAFIFITSAPFLFTQSPDAEHKESDIHKTEDVDLFSEIFPDNSRGITQFNFSLRSTAFNESNTSILIRDTHTVKFKMKKSPLLAVMLSAAIPGAGQFYNQSYWKIPIIAGLAGYFGYEYFRNNNKFKDYRDRYNSSITVSNPFGDENLKTLREFYRNQRDDFVWYFIILYVVNLVDAYVDAHLFDFDVKEEKIKGYGTSEMKLKLNINF